MTIDERKSVESFIEEYGERAYRFAFRLCRNVDEAHDLVQEALLRAMQRWDKYDQTRPLAPWFFRILRNIFYDSRKRYERRYGVSLSLLTTDDSCLEDIIPNEEPSSLDELEQQEIVGIVQNGLRSLLKVQSFTAQRNETGYLR